MDPPEPPDLAGLRLIRRIADEGSLAAVARGAGLSASAVGKALTRLERQMGTRLFHRSTRSLRPSEEGRMVLARARRILDEAEALQQDLAGRSEVPSGRLRLSLPLVGEPFVGLLAAFSRAYPEIHVDIDFSDRQVDLIAEGYDAAIRSGPVPNARMMATSLGSFRMELVASPAYVTERGTPAIPEALVDHRLIGFRFAHDGRIGSWPVGDDVAIDLAVAIVSNNLEARVAFALAGAGIALLPSFALVSHVGAGRLVRILPDLSQTVPLTLIWPSGHHLAPRVRVFSDFMKKRLRPLMS